MVTTFMVAGTRDEVCERVEALGRVAEVSDARPARYWRVTLPPERVTAYREAIVEAFYPARQ